MKLDKILFELGGMISMAPYPWSWDWNDGEIRCANGNTICKEDTIDFLNICFSQLPQLIAIAEGAKRAIANGGQMTDGNFGCNPVDIAVLSSRIEVLEAES